jgi:phosphoesterase RecJ-like protein
MVVEYSEKNHGLFVKIFDEAEIVFCLDFSQPHRMYPLDQFLNPEKQIVAMIDHHIGKANFAHFEYWDTKAGATAELIYLFIEDLGDKHLINRKIGECLYAGIMTDTGSFKFASTSARIHRIAADLYDLGINAALIHQLVYDTRTHNQLRFLGFCIGTKLKVLPELATAYFVITRQELLDYKVRSGDTEGIVNYALSIQGINLAGIFIEYEEEIRISFRSFGTFDVAKMASNKFNGGGHKNAAGGKRTDGLENCVKDFLEIVKANADLITNSSLSV